MIHRKSAAEQARMRESGRAVAAVLEMIENVVVPGITTADIEAAVDEECRRLQVVPAFKGYMDYPSSICVSVNEEVVHGIPSGSRRLEEGDIVSLDFGVLHKGYYGDAAVTLPVGRVSSEAERLMQVTRESLQLGIAAAREGNRVGDISHAVQSYVEENGFSVVKVFVGHGIGRHLHEDPQVPNFGDAHMGARLKEGMTLAIEPMVNLGGDGVRVLEDGWTAITVDGSISAHYEHTVLVTADGPEILTHIGNQEGRV